MDELLSYTRSALAHLRRPVAHGARLATRLQRTTKYGFDLMLWSRLFAKRRGPLPLDLPRPLLATKGIGHPAPSLHVSGPADLAITWEDGFAAVNATLFMNLQTPDVLSRFRYAHPSPAFKGIYLWDSAFIAQIWKWWDIATAREILEAVMALRDGDRIQHVVADFVSSPYTQPPLIAWSLLGLDRAVAPDERVGLRLPEAFEVLSAFNEWLYRERRGPDGLFFWEHAYESGVENSPRFGARDEKLLVDTRRRAAPDLSAFVILQNEALAELAEAAGVGGAAERFHDRARELRTLVNEKLWHEADGFYYDRDFASGDLVRSRTIAGLFPLWAGVPDASRARRLLEHVLSPTGFNTPTPLPSVARDDPGFVLDMWRGPVWINAAYGVIRGLERYGFLREAVQLAWKLCHGVYDTHTETRRLYEFYDPEESHVGRLNRKLGNRWKKLTLGNKPRHEFVGWTGLVNTLVIEDLVGVHRDAAGRLALRPRFPAEAANLGFGLRLPAADAAVQLDVLDASGRVRGTARRAGRVQPFEAAFDEVVPFP